MFREIEKTDFKQRLSSERLRLVCNGLRKKIQQHFPICKIRNTQGISTTGAGSLQEKQYIIGIRLIDRTMISLLSHHRDMATLSVKNAPQDAPVSSGGILRSVSVFGGVTPSSCPVVFVSNHT